LVLKKKKKGKARLGTVGKWFFALTSQFF